MQDYNTLEICVESLESGIAAAQAGADRLEVNYALALGGLTPSIALVTMLKEKTNIPLIAMIRPRHGYFTYSDLEFMQMQKEAETLLKAGADGIAFGFIDRYGKIDLDRVKSLVSLADGRETVFHRAFDLLENRLINMHKLADIGVTRILTSGGKRSAIEGRHIIKKLISEAAGSIEILPASGIRPYNAKEFLEYTGATQLHSSCLKKVPDKYAKPSDITFIDSEISDHIKISIDSDNVSKLVSLKVIR
jgi:copper homeostasis protein